MEIGGLTARAEIGIETVRFDGRRVPSRRAVVESRADAEQPARPWRRDQGVTKKARRHRGDDAAACHKWAWEELNLRPHAYQACALTT